MASLAPLNSLALAASSVADDLGYVALSELSPFAAVLTASRIAG